MAVAKPSRAGASEHGGDVVSSRNDTGSFPPEAAQVAELTQRSLRWLVLVALVYRVGVTIPAVLLNRSVLPSAGGGLLLIGLGVLLLDGVLILVTVRRPTWLATRRLFFVLDVAVALTMTFAATLLLPRGMFLV